MSKLIASADPALAASPIQIAPLTALTNPHAPEAGRLASSPASSAVPASTAGADQVQHKTLKALDKHFGPLRIGEILTSRVELKALGAMVNGQAISPANAGMQSADQAFLDGLNFDSDTVVVRLKSVDSPDSGVAALLFYEIACKRSIGAPPLFSSVTGLEPGSAVDRLNQLGKAAQKLDIHRVVSFENTPDWVNRNKSYLMSGAGVGLQAFGIYSGYNAMIDAIKRGDSLEAVFQGGSIAAELGSLIIEQGLTKTGQAMLTNGATAFKYFPLSSVGKYMSRGAGMFASAITLPFDIADAVKSFNAAAASQGKEAQDHYVSAGLSVASAGISVALGVAALAGFGSTAGPVGLAAAALLIAGSMIYQAARVVDDIDDYIELSAHERLRSGWFAFTGQELDKDVMDRFKLSKGFADHQKQLQLSARELLEGAYKNSIEHVINGAFKVELVPVEIWRYQWDESAGEKPFKLDTQVTIVGADDVIDASKGLPADLNGKVSGSAGEGKGVLWRLGDGSDQITGVQATPNVFTYRDGQKTLSGGDRDDLFHQIVSAEQLNRAATPARLSHLDGGAGSDTLALEGSRPRMETRHVGHDINLQNGTLALRNFNAAVANDAIAQLSSIENVSTLHQGSSVVIGNDDANRICANGNDRINAGAGDDRIDLTGAFSIVNGGSGADHYRIANTNVQTTIIEDAKDSSLIELGWPLADIQQWEIDDTHLIVRSLRDKDGDEALHELSLIDIYQRVDGQRLLKNAQWRFKTQDGFELQALLPVQPGQAPRQSVEVAISINGKPAPAPEIVNSGTVEITGQSLHQHFVARTDHRVEFDAVRNTSESARTVYLDFKDSEIVDVVVSYTAQIHEGVSGNQHLTYQDITLSILLPSKVVMFKGVVQPMAAATGYSGRNGLKVTTVRLIHDTVITLQDGVSYRLQVPDLNYEADAREPGTKIYSSRDWLKRRNGQYPLVRPLATERKLLDASASKITIDTRAHTGIYVFEGQSSIYDVHLASNSIVRLSTPGAAAKTANASIWNLYTQALKEPVTREDIRLDGNTLLIASVTVELPAIDEDAPVESISVATTSGNVYEVSLLFEVFQLYVIDARGYASVEALMADIDRHQQRHELAGKVYVSHLGLKSASTGTVFYNSIKQYWSLNNDPQVRIKTDDLVILRAEKA